eukprot:976174-Rhodomonas_salina.1
MSYAPAGSALATSTPLLLNRRGPEQARPLTLPTAPGCAVAQPLHLLDANGARRSRAPSPLQ